MHGGGKGKVVFQSKTREVLFVSVRSFVKLQTAAEDFL